MKHLLSAAIVAASLSMATSAAAQVTEVRAGANIHDIDWTGLGKGSDKERAFAINAEILFEEPEFLKWALSPQPYIGGTLNLEGKTSYGGAGLLWRQNFGDRFYGDFSFGLVVHDGTLELQASQLVRDVVSGAVTPPFPDSLVVQYEADLADLRLRQQSEIDFGSRILFREQFVLGYRFTDDWAGEIFAEHLSHGNILVRGKPNEGLDAIGIRASRRF